VADRERMFIAKGGRLMDTKWVYDEEKEEGEYVTKDITDRALTKLFEPCELAEDVTLRDVFLLIKRDLKMYTVIINNWVEEFVEEAFTKPDGDFYSDDDDVEYLELYWFLEDYNDDPEDKYLVGNIRPDFYGIGTCADWGDEPCPFSLMFTPVNEIIDLPLRLAPSLVIYEWLGDKKGEYKNPQFSLGQILEAIIWELSFCGPPQTRDDTSKEVLGEMREAIAERHNGKV
jgi:hypothetical protein